jgi:hypothetical protein
MTKVDMSVAAVTARLKRVSQLRRLGLSLQKAKIKKEVNKTPRRAKRKRQSHRVA